VRSRWRSRDCEFSELHGGVNLLQKGVSWGMKRAMLLDHLAYVERHISDGERHLLRQREIVDELERHGRGDSQTAKNGEGNLGDF
jgi:hypothetical protein